MNKSYFCLVGLKQLGYAEPRADASKQEVEVAKQRRTSLSGGREADRSGNSRNVRNNDVINTSVTRYSNLAPCFSNK